MTAPSLKSSLNSLKLFIRNDQYHSLGMPFDAPTLVGVEFSGRSAGGLQRSSSWESHCPRGAQAPAGCVSRGSRGPLCSEGGISCLGGPVFSGSAPKDLGFLAAQRSPFCVGAQGWDSHWLLRGVGCPCVGVFLIGEVGEACTGAQEETSFGKHLLFPWGAAWLGPQWRGMRGTEPSCSGARVYVL